MKKPSKEAMLIARHIGIFLNEYAPSQKTSSEHTLKSYNTALALYLGFLESAKGVTADNMCGESFSVQNIEEWLLWLNDKRGCSPETCNVRLASLRAFLKYLGKREVSMMHLSMGAMGIERRKIIRKQVQGLSKEGVKALLDTPNLSTKTGRRDLALLVLMYSTATRIDEVLSLKVKHLYADAKKPYITILGKGGKIRTLYLLPKAVSHIKAYMQEFHGDTPNSDSYVFYSRNGGGKMTQPAINKQLKKYAAIANSICKDIPITLHAHQIRHAKASHWLDDGMNIVQISFLLGHEQLETTMKYLAITTEQGSKALATLEDESTRQLPKKWKVEGDSLAGFCGVRSLKN